MTNNVRVGMTNNVRVGMTSNMYTEHDNSGNVKNSVFLYPMLITIVFILGYLAIVFEHPLKVNKTASALLTGVLCWVLYGYSEIDHKLVSEQLVAHLGEISGILFFLLSAMAIVELIDAHDGFDVITAKIKTTSDRKLLWIVSILTFFMSAVLDNLTTTIIMISLLRKLVGVPKTRMLFAGLVIIASNAGGAWSTIGDVTTTMLWIGGQITAFNFVKELFLPALVCLLVPLVILSFRMKGTSRVSESVPVTRDIATKPFEQNLILVMGFAAMLFVPVFKTLTGLPPFMGILFSLGILWIATEIIHRKRDDKEKDMYSVVRALSRTDVTSVLFFLGILVAISALESTGKLASLAAFMNEKIGNVSIIAIAIGLLSAVVDNVPLVAATMGMYDLTTFPTDHYFWEFIAYTTGTGGSCLILGSAAGVAAMGMEKMDFIWYLKRFSLLAVAGYFAGAVVFIGQQFFFG
jgi:Na+/H+ antiporter NhaD/arsenite permease-like protein